MLYDEPEAYMSSPFCELQNHQPEQAQGIDVTIPTPPPETTHDSPDSTHSSQGFSPQLSASATSDSYIKGSSLEESPVSSPSSSYAGEIHSPQNEEEQDFIESAVITQIPKLIKRESCIRSTSEQRSVVAPDNEANSNLSGNVPREQNVPKNIKLPQSKFWYNYSQ